MAFDGITVAAVTKELREKLLNLRINKISQPEADEILLTIKGNSTQYRLLISADASLPLLYLTDTNKQSPMNAPAFCMLLRKHIQNARIVDIMQPELERVICMEFEHLDEMGDLCRKRLMIELMGKHSNIIFCDDRGMILDSIKHISGMVSSVREVLPGRDYFIPKTTDRKNPLTVTREEWKNIVAERADPVFQAIFRNLNGLSPQIAQEICYRCGVEGDLPCSTLKVEQTEALYDTLRDMMKQVEGGSFTPAMYLENGAPCEYSCVLLTSYGNRQAKPFDSVSELLQEYYAKKNRITRMRQKTVDLRRIIGTALERNYKKYDLQTKQLQDAGKREKYRVYGELLNTYGYDAKGGERELTVWNYYSNENMTIPLDPTLSARENAQRYFDKYGKLKRTAQALTELTQETAAEISHLESIATAIDIAQKEEDLAQIKEEMIESGYIRRKGGSGKASKAGKGKPFHYVSSDGFDIYVGKNNYQNDELTFQFANGNDWWFHAKGMPGSHVVLRCNNREVPDRSMEEAASLAAYYSRGREQDKVEIDYTVRKNVKKPNGAKPGFVVYYTNYSMVARPGTQGLTDQND